MRFGGSGKGVVAWVSGCVYGKTGGGKPHRRNRPYLAYTTAEQKRLLEASAEGTPVRSRVVVVLRLCMFFFFADPTGRGDRSSSSFCRDPTGRGDRPSSSWFKLFCFLAFCFLRLRSIAFAGFSNLTRRSGLLYICHEPSCVGRSLP